jgi:hypothetical protein
VLVAGVALQKYGERLTEEQEIVGALSDIAMEVFAMESAVLRALKLLERAGEKRAEIPCEIARTSIASAVSRVDATARMALSALAEGDDLRMLLAALRRLTRHEPFNTIAARRRIADAMIQAGQYAV